MSKAINKQSLFQKDEGIAASLSTSQYEESNQQAESLPEE